MFGRGLQRCSLSSVPGPSSGRLSETTDAGVVPGSSSHRPSEKEEQDQDD